MVCRKCTIDSSKALEKLNDADEGCIKFTKAGLLADWASSKGWLIRCFAKQIQELCDSESALGKCLDKAGRNWSQRSRLVNESPRLPLMQAL